MPILKHAKKKLLVDRKRALANRTVKSKALSAVKKYKESPSGEALRQSFSTLDRAAKKGIFHKGKVDRIKSRLSKLLKKEDKKETVAKKVVKKTAGKVTKKTTKK